MFPDFKMASFRCTEMGKNCSYTIVARSKEELLRNIRNHAIRIHGMEDLPPDLPRRLIQPSKLVSSGLVYLWYLWAR